MSDPENSVLKQRFDNLRATFQKLGSSFTEEVK